VIEGLLDQFADALIAVTREGAVSHWSAGAERVFGFTHDEAVGRSLTDLLELPEDGGIDRVGMAVAAGEITYETRCVRKDGACVHVDVTMRAFRADGDHVVVSMKDVSLLKYIREADVLEAKFHGLLEVAADAYILVNASGRIVLVNVQAQQLFGYEPRELLGQPIELLVPERYRGRHPGHRAAFADNPHTRPMGAEFDLWARRKDGSEFPAEISLAPVRTDDAILTSAAIRNVSDRRVTEAALKLANKELESFSYSVAHDLRAPLRGMNGFAQVLLEEYRDKLDADGLDCLHEIRDNAERMGALIDALLGLSRVSRSELRPSRVDLSGLVRSITGALERDEPERRPETIVQDRLSAVLDPTLARMLLENLLANAWKFSKGDRAARVAFGALPDDPNTFFIQDNGAGFDMAHADKLFAAFQRLHTVTEFPGTGIGLATAHTGASSI
jgi:PAS domain S-box-containing protein